MKIEVQADRYLREQLNRCSYLMISVFCLFIGIISLDPAFDALNVPLHFRNYALMALIGVTAVVAVIWFLNLKKLKTESKDGSKWVFEVDEEDCIIPQPFQRVDWLHTPTRAIKSANLYILEGIATLKVVAEGSPKDYSLHIHARDVHTLSEYFKQIGVDCTITVGGESD